MSDYWKPKDSEFIRGIVVGFPNNTGYRIIPPKAPAIEGFSKHCLDCERIVSNWFTCFSLNRLF